MNVLRSRQSSSQRLFSGNSQRDTGRELVEQQVELHTGANLDREEGRGTL